MKLARSLIGAVVANESFATGYFCNLFPPLRGATRSLPPDLHPWPPAIAAGTTAVSELFLGRWLGWPPDAVLQSRSPRLGLNRLDGQIECL